MPVDAVVPALADIDPAVGPSVIAVVVGMSVTAPIDVPPLSDPLSPSPPPLRFDPLLPGQPASKQTTIDDATRPGVTRSLYGNPAGDTALSARRRS
jgi:hypothetical protein